MRISPSVFAADPLRIADQVAAVAPFVESLHVDVMDGRFAPRFGLNEDVVARLAETLAVPLDVHLMIDDPLEAAVRFTAAGVRLVAFHAASPDEAVRVSSEVRARGVLAYLALRPDEPIGLADRIREHLDGVLILSAPAGGGAFDEAAFDRIDRIPAGRRSIVDGKLDETRFDRLRRAGVDLAVVGRALFAHEDPASLLRRWSEQEPPPRGKTFASEDARRLVASSRP